MVVRDGTKEVATAGTRVPLKAARTDAYGLSVHAPAANTGTIFIGGPTVSATSGIEVAKGTSYTFPPLPLGMTYDLNLIYADAATSGDDIKFVYLSKY